MHQINGVLMFVNKPALMSHGWCWTVKVASTPWLFMIDWAIYKCGVPIDQRCLPLNM